MTVYKDSRISWRYGDMCLYGICLPKKRKERLFTSFFVPFHDFFLNWWISFSKKDLKVVLVSGGLELRYPVIGIIYTVPISYCFFLLLFVNWLLFSCNSEWRCMMADWIQKTISWSISCLPVIITVTFNDSECVMAHWSWGIMHSY